MPREPDPGTPDTIFALVTAPGRAGVAVVRVSGPDARAAAERLAGPLPEHGRSLRSLRADGDLLDQALLLTFAAPRSFTGEAVAELHLHGAPSVVAAVLRALGATPGLRPAEAGEFTRRAFAAGRLDLAQVEGLADLLAAETEGQRRQAVRVLGGALGRLAEALRARLLRAAALLAASIDFADEDVPADVTAEVRGLLAGVRADLLAEAEGARLAERVREGFEVAIVGAPNAGKSTLLNRLAGREAAIVSAVAGTTRDVIEVRMDLGGLPVTLLDTAGLRDGRDEVESLGIERGRLRAARADLRVHLLLAGEAAPESGPDDLAVRAKADLARGEGPGVSGLTGEGVDALVDEVANRLATRAAGIGTASRQRHARAMAGAAEALAEALALLDEGAGAEVVAESVRAALLRLDALVGRVGTEDILGELFASFCIGK